MTQRRYIWARPYIITVFTTILSISYFIVIIYRQKELYNHTTMWHHFQSQSLSTRSRFAHHDPATPRDSAHRIRWQYDTITRCHIVILQNHQFSQKLIHPPVSTFNDFHHFIFHLFYHFLSTQNKYPKYPNSCPVFIKGFCWSLFLWGLFHFGARIGIFGISVFGWSIFLINCINYYFYFFRERKEEQLI